MARGHWDEGISGWISDFGPPADQLSVHRERLTGLVGQRLIGGWTAWYTARDYRGHNTPVVLVFEGGDRLELDWDVRNPDISITWNTIDLSIPPTVFHGVCEWRRGEPWPLGDVIGRALTGFAIVESPYFRSETEDLHFGSWSDLPPVHALAGWDIDGLWLAFGDRGLRVSSCVDGAALHADLGLQHWRRPALWPPSGVREATAAADQG